MKHVIFVMERIATVMEIVQTTTITLHVIVNQNTSDKTVNKETPATVTLVHMETVQILTKVSIVHAKKDTRALPVMVWITVITNIVQTTDSAITKSLVINVTVMVVILVKAAKLWIIAIRIIVLIRASVTTTAVHTNVHVI